MINPINRLHIQITKRWETSFDADEFSYGPNQMIVTSIPEKHSKPINQIREDMVENTKRLTYNLTNASDLAKLLIQEEFSRSNDFHVVVYNGVQEDLQAPWEFHP